MRIFKNLILLLIFVFQSRTENEVIEMTLKNYDYLISTPQYVFLLFYTNWCHHCKTIMEEVTKAASFYKNNSNPSILFAKINGVLEKDLLEKYDIGEYPTLKFLFEKTSYDYSGGRTAQEIIEWVESKTKNTTTEIFSLEEFDNKINDNDLIIAYFGKNASVKFDTFLHVSRIVDKETFIHSFDEGLREKFLTNKEWSGIMIFFNNGLSQVNYEGDMSSPAKILEFINDNKFALIANFSQKLAEKVFGENKKCLFLFLDDSEKSKDAFEALKRAAVHLKDKIIMSVVTYDTKLNERLSDFLGVNRSALPLVIFKITPKLNLNQDKIG